MGVLDYKAAGLVVFGGLGDGRFFFFLVHVLPQETTVAS
jgi:hypothetical protein